MTAIAQTKAQIISHRLSASAKKEGAGLGLFLAKGAAQAMGGSVSLKNRDDQKGAIATFEMDIKK